MKPQGLIIGIFLLIFTGIAYFLYTSHQNYRQARATSGWITHTHEVIKHIDRIESEFYLLESNVRGYVISGNKVFTATDEKDIKKIHDEFEQLKGSTVDNQVQQAHLKELKSLMLKKLEFQDEITEAYPTNPQKAESLISSLYGKKLSELIKARLQQMRVVEQQLLDDRTQNNRELLKNKYNSSLIGGIAVLLLFSIGLIQIGRQNTLRRKAEADATRNDAKYKSLVENAAFLVATLDAEGRFDFISNKCESLCGYPSNELIGRSFQYLIDTEWQDKVANFYVNQYYQQLDETTLCFPIRTKQGNEKWVEQNALLLRENGVIKGFQCIIKDITEKRHTEALLEEAEQAMARKQEEYHFRMQAILDHLPMIVYLKDLDGRYLMVNRHFKEALKVTDDIILGKTALDISGQSTVGNQLVADEKVKQTLSPVELEDIITTTAGERHMLVTKFPLFDKQGKLFAVCGVDKDITEMVRNRNELVQARLRAESAEKLQEEFLANMSHEIRTPMNGIIGMTHVLSDMGLTQAQQECLKIVRQSSDSLLVLINDILDLSKIKAGRMVIDTVDFSVQEVIDQVVAPMHLRIAEKGLRLNLIIDKQLPPFVKGDQQKLLQVLNNLLSNAVKFTEVGSITLDVKVNAGNSDTAELEFSIIDTGIGIAADKVDSVFESFVQAGNDMVRRFGGTGLGLAITRRLLEMQGGMISVESVEGKGSRFSFRIPYGQSERTTENVTPATVQGLTFQTVPGRKVLIVEDNEINQKVIATILIKAGYEVVVANNGRLAVEVLQRGLVCDLIIMDLQMPEMDGFQATAFIRNKLQLPTPIIAMTASALRNEKQKCLELGMNAYFPKPFAPSDILREISCLLQVTDDLKMATVTSTEKPNPLYNLAYLLEIDDRNFVKDILVQFLENTPRVLEEMKSDAMHENWERVHAKAHKLKSSLGILQVHKMLEGTAAIESAAKEKQDLDIVPNRIQSLMEQFYLMQPMLRAEIAEAV